MSLITDFDTAERLVKSVLKDHKSTRADDQELLLQVWEKQGLHLTTSQKTFFRKLLSAETITRVRRHLQANGFFKPNSAVYEQRQLLSEEVRQWIR